MMLERCKTPSTGIFWRLVEGFYRATGIRVKQVDIAWRQYGSLSEKPGDHVIVKVSARLNGGDTMIGLTFLVILTLVAGLMWRWWNK